MRSDVPAAALSVLGSISLSRIDQCHGPEGHSSGRFATPLASTSGGRTPVHSPEMRRCGDDYASATFLPSRTGCRGGSLRLRAGRQSTAHFPFVSGEVGSKRLESSRGAGANLIREEGVSALCSSIGVDGPRKHTGQLPPSEYGTHMEKCVRRISPSGRREKGGFAASATADSDQTVPSPNGGGEKTIPTKPHPEVHPAEVVQAQLKALREKDLATVFEFASPANKARTGPLLRFSEMLEGRAYNVMIGHTSAEILSTITISNNRFQQRITIKGSDGKQATFQWSLSRQEEGPYESCWMTDGVRRDE